MQQTIGERIELVIKSLGLKNAQVAEDLSVSQAQISRIISGDRNASPRLLKDFYSQYGVNPDWLENGEGDMFLEKTLTASIDAFAAKVGSLDDSAFPKRFAAMLERLEPRHWEVLAEIAEMLYESQNEKEDRRE